MIKEYENELNELKESELISKEDLHEGDEIIYNGEHYFVTLTDTGTDFVWITDDESERYNRNAQGWTLKADWIDKVIGQPEEDELEESCKSNTLKNTEIIKEDVNMSRKEMIDWIEDHWNDTVEHGEWLYGYLTELGFNVEDDSDEEEGFYANLTTSNLRKIVDELKPNTKTSVKEQIAGIRKALETLGKVSDVSLDYAGAEEATFDVNLKYGDTFRIQIYKM